MPRERAFLVRAPDGTMRTVMATTIRSAAELFRSRFRPPRGAMIEIKERGQGSWESFRVVR